MNAMNFTRNNHMIFDSLNWRTATAMCHGNTHTNVHIVKTLNHSGGIILLVKPPWIHGKSTFLLNSNKNVITLQNFCFLPPFHLLTCTMASAVWYTHQILHHNRKFSYKFSMEFNLIEMHGLNFTFTENRKFWRHSNGEELFNLTKKKKTRQEIYLSRNT